MRPGFGLDTLSKMKVQMTAGFEIPIFRLMYLHTKLINVQIQNIFLLYFSFYLLYIFVHKLSLKLM